MIYYLIPILIGLLVSFYEVKFGSFTSKSPVFKNIFLLFTAVIFCGGYMTGSDWRDYELMYNDASIANFNYYFKEQGFYFLMLAFKKIGVGFFPFMIFFKFLVFYIVASFISKHFKSFYLPFTIFLSGSALFLFVDNPLRFMVAFGVIVLSYKYLIERKLLIFSAFVLLASLFHISSVVMFLIYFTPNLKLNKASIIIIYFTLFFVLTPSTIDPIIRLFPDFLMTISTYYNEMHRMDYNPFRLGKIINAIFFLIIIYNKSTIIKTFKEGKIIYALTIAFFFLGLIGFIIPTFFRLKYYVSLFFFLSIASILLYGFKYKVFIKIFFISYMLFASIKSIYAGYVYVPYSNYFVSLFQKEMPYTYRANYNKKKYFERTGTWPM